MADLPTAPATTTWPNADESSAPPVEVRATTADATTDGVAAAPTDETKAGEPGSAQPSVDESAATKTDDQPTSEKEADNIENKKTGADASEAAPATANGTSDTPKMNGKRKSVGGAPDHKSKKLNKKKSVANLNIDVVPGEYWWARMKGYSAWPVIICDEAMLPETLLNKRPVSAVRADGTYREDFKDGGKNVRDRRYPVMFLGTNEFAWQVNTELTRLDMAEVKKAVEENDQGKKAKNLWEAWKVTAEAHDLEYFKKLLMDHEKAMAEDAEERAAKEAEKAEKAAKKGKRKSKSGAGDADVEMEDAADETDSAGKKATKKRKKEADSSEADELKPAKTPKTKLKVNGPKTPADASATKTKKTPASKAKGSKLKADSEAETPKPEVEQLTPAQQFEKRQKAILYLRHRLQKGFLTRDQAPKEEEMQQMSEYFTQLEAHADLEVGIIKETKINKVLKAIIKLDSIPKDEVYNFKKRSADLLTAWNKSIASEGESGAAASAEPESKTNGEVKEGAIDTKSSADETPAATEQSKPEDSPKDVEMKEPTEAPAETNTEAGNKKIDGEGDTAMEDAKPAEKTAADATEGAKDPAEATAAA